MKVKYKKRYIKWKEKIESEYSNEVFEFAERWAGMMEIEIRKGKKIKNIYQKLLDKANINGITGAMYFMGLKMLVECWKYGKELKEAIIKNGTGKVISSSSL